MFSSKPTNQMMEMISNEQTKKLVYARLNSLITISHISCLSRIHSSGKNSSETHGFANASSPYPPYWMLAFMYEKSTTNVVRTKYSVYSRRSHDLVILLTILVAKNFVGWLVDTVLV